MRKKFTIWSVYKITFLGAFVLAIVLPFMHMISISLSGNMAVMMNKVGIFPVDFTIHTYQFVLGYSAIMLAYRNTIIYTVLGTIIPLAVTASGSYAVSKKHMTFGGFLIKLMLVCNFVGGGMIPTFIVVMRLGLLNTIWAMVLPGCVAPYYFLVLMSFFKSIPAELEDAGKIDGLNDIGAMRHIALPLSKAGLTTIGLFYAIGAWNDFYSAFIYLGGAINLQPVTVFLRSMLTRNTALDGQLDPSSPVIDVTIKYTVLMITIIPIMCVYPFIRKYFVKGVMIGSVKG